MGHDMIFGQNPKKYPAKVLLFGEYTVLFGGAALAIPYTFYNGFWSSNCSTDTDIMPLQDFVAYLRIINPSLRAPLDLDALVSVIDSGTSFCSDIPIGQGLGSSGALAASVYDMFSHGAEMPMGQKHDLSLIEGFFHGRSSGIDALVSYLHKPVYQQVDKLDMPEEISYKHQGYLWKTNTKRSTGPLVEWFEQSCRDEAFRERMTKLARLSTSAIEACLKGEAFIEISRRIGSIQFNHMTRLIPVEVKKYWLEISTIDQVSIKLCGAGGGGCFLLFSEGVDLQALFPELKLEKIW